MPILEEEGAAEASMGSDDVQDATAEAEAAVNSLNDDVSKLTQEDQKKREAQIYKIEITVTYKIVRALKLPEGVDPLSSEDLNKLQDTSRDLAESVGEPGEILPELEESVGNIDEDVGNRLNSSMRPFLEAMSSKIDDLIKENSGEAKFSQFKDLQSKVTESVENKDPSVYEEATTNLDSFIDEDLGESKTALEEKTEGRGNLKNFSRIASFLKLLGIIGLLGLLTVLFKMDNGCWEWTNGAKTQKINDFDFSKDDNKKFCACSNTSTFDTPQPLSSWCPSGVTKGTPTYVTCPPYQYPACTVKKDSSGIYYSYYIASPLGVFNSLVNQTSKIIKKGGQGLLVFVKWAIVIICIFISLYFTYLGFTEEEWLYAAGVLVMAGAATAGWIFI